MTHFTDDPEPLIQKGNASKFPAGGPSTLPQAEPIFWSPDLFGGSWVVSRYADAEYVLRDPKFSARRTAGWVYGSNNQERNSTRRNRDTLAPFQALLARSMIFLDTPDHDRLRRLMHSAFTPTGLVNTKAWIASLCEELLDDAVREKPEDKEFDFIEMIARPLPAAVMTKLMGLPTSSTHNVMDWSSDLALFLEETSADVSVSSHAQKAALHMLRLFETEIRRRDGDGDGFRKDDLFDMLRFGLSEDAIHDVPELLAQATMLLFAGHETTRHFLGNLVLTLLNHPGEWARLAALPTDAQDVEAARVVREVLRLEAPLRYTGRRVAISHEFGGQQLRRGQSVVVMISTANRDPQKYAQPNEYLPGRKGTSSLSFGAGPHVCIGAALTLLEAQTCLTIMLRRWPNLQNKSRLAHEDWIPSRLYRGLRSLPLSVRG